jgi:membrane protease YdiL (CAAX protease family)
MGFGFEYLTILFIVALFKTSFAEELFFRGFIAKRLKSILGFQKGNLFQSIIFGLIHAVLFSFITSNIIFLIVIFIVPSIGAFATAYVNEKIANGSILPGWISHGLANVLSYFFYGLCDINRVKARKR